MTECTYKYNNKSHDLVCQGHASEEGEDKSVCAAVTVLLHTLAFDIEESNDMCAEKEIKVEDGYYHIKVKPIEGAEEQMEFLFGAFVNGLYMLSEDPKLKKRITLNVSYDEEPSGDADSEI